MKAKLFVTGFAFILLLSSNAAEPLNPLAVEKLKYPKLVEKFYQQKGAPLFFFGKSEAGYLRVSLKSLLDSSAYLGLNKENYHYKFIVANVGENKNFDDSLFIISADKIFTDALISLSKDIYAGADMNEWLSYDEISAKYAERDNDQILTGLTSVSSANELEYFIRFLEPVSKDYLKLKLALRNNIASNYKDTINRLSQTLNVLRWIKHFQLSQFVVVNTASAVLRYYTADTLNLRMKVVVGKKETPTPRFAAYCDQVILYPYWNVPYSIAVKEMLPAIKRSRGYLDSRNLQVIDSRGRIVNPASVNWSSLSARNFPYQLRQSTGCDNALGVIKFNLTDPFSVYMHDTNSKTAFLAGARYFSHGCIRLEKPVELASEFLPGKINTAFLEACEKNQKPVQLRLAEPVPVFVVYMTCEFNETGEVKYYKDIYKLFK